MVKIDELKELMFKCGLYNVSKLNDFDFDIKDPKEYLLYVLKLEQELRSKNNKSNHRRKSNLPNVDLNKKYSGIDEWNMNELLKLDWLDKCNNLLFYGKCGTGKTTAVVQIANKALDKGYKVYYLKIESLMQVLKTKETLSKSKKIFDYMKQCDLIIIDDLMYIPLTEEELLMLYKAVMFLNESRSLAFITNRRLDDWRDACEGSHTIETLVDRIISYSRVIAFK